MATPYLCRPFERGADIVVHSTTKFLVRQRQRRWAAWSSIPARFDWSQSDKFPSLTEPAPEYHGLTFAETFGDIAYTIYGHAVGLRDLGACQSPMNAWLTLLGIETLALRMERHCANALAVAEFLERHPAVAWVSYAGLPTEPLPRAGRSKYLPKGAGAVFTFGVKGGYEAGTCAGRERSSCSAISPTSATRDR